MLANNNQPILRRMAEKSLKNNRRRTMILLTAIALSSFMLFSVLTVGITYFKMQQVQNIRLNGAKFDAILYGVTDEQRKSCENNPDIVRTGIEANAGYVEETEYDSTPGVSFMWADDTYWNTMAAPAREWMKGKYPTETYEVMASPHALEKCGLADLEIGGTFRMTYTTETGTHTQEFTLSGLWEGYGEKSVLYVSRSFYENESGMKLEDVGSGHYHLDFRQKIMTQKQQQEFIDSLHLGKQQALFFMADMSASFELLTGLLGLVLITCLCAYLLIYNILYLSVSGNIRYYGLLQTVGMTGRQIYQLMLRQMALVGLLGTAAGIALGSLVSFFLIPSIVRFLGIRLGAVTEIQVAFHPAVFLLTIFITGLTVYLGSRKPARMAVSISPLEALGYRKNSGKAGVKKTGTGKLSLRMAKEQFAKDRKKSAVVILSLGISLSVFLCMITLIKSQAARTIVSNYMDLDLVVKNDTLEKDNREKRVQLLDQKFMDGLEEISSIKEMHSVLAAEITVPWEPKFSDLWMKEFYDTWMREPYETVVEEYKEHPENFGSYLVGIDETDFDCLNATLEHPVDKADFLEGRTCILYQNRLAFTQEDLEGKTVTCAEFSDPSHTRSFTIAGLTGEPYYAGALPGYAPGVIVADTALKDFAADPFVYKTGIRYESAYDEETEKAVLAEINTSPYAKDFSYESKLEEMKSVKKAQGSMMEVGMGIVFILAFIGILNYVNTVTGNIQSRQVELAVLESIGMTEKQIRRMLMLEGLCYAGGSLLLAATVGLGVTYCLFQSMNYRHVPFSVPVLPTVCMAVLTVLVCFLVPLAARRNLLKKSSVIERVQGFE